MNQFDEIARTLTGKHVTDDGDEQVYISSQMAEHLARKVSAASTTDEGNTHYAVIVFGGDLDNDHPDETLRGYGPQMTLIAAGPEQYCWDALERWTAEHELQRDETAEVVKRDPSVVRLPPGKV